MKRDQASRQRFLGGNARFGYDVTEEGALAPVPEKLALLDEMRRMRDRGMSLRAIATAVSARGAPFSFGHVRRILAAAD